MKLKKTKNNVRLPEKLANTEVKMNFQELLPPIVITLFENISDPISIIENGVFVSCNEATLKMLQIDSKNNLIGKTPWDISPQLQMDGTPSDVKAKELLQICLEKGSSRFEWIHKRDNGTLFYADIILTHAPDTEAILVLWRDISDEVENRRKVFESEEKYRITLNSIGDAVITTDIEGNVRMMNYSAENLTGWKEDDAAGKHLDDIFVIVNAFSKEKVQSPVSKILKSGNVVGLAKNTVLVSKDGTEHQIADSGAPIKDDKGKIRGFVLVFRDVTRTCRLEEQLKQSEKMDAIGKMASGMAHDFNNMVGGIIGGADLLVDMLDAQDESRFYAQKIKEAGIKAAEMTSQVLTFARKSNGKREPVDVYGLVRETVDMIGASLGDNVKVDISLDGKASVISDKGHLQSAFINLIFNARDAMPKGGTITFRSEKIEILENVYNSLMLSAGSFLKLSVSDTGEGVDEKISDKIFEPFFTTKKGDKGTGLGLASAQRAVKEHGGEIELVSKVGEGSDFIIYLPLKD